MIKNLQELFKITIDNVENYTFYTGKLSLEKNTA